jgi:hypothetical protein
MCVRCVASRIDTRGLGWRIHCGVEVTESSTNENNASLSFVASAEGALHLSGLSLKRCRGC